jgi:hypothetical protein
MEREHQLPLDDAIRIAREVADALEAAHQGQAVTFDHSAFAVPRRTSPLTIHLTRSRCRVT